MLAAISTAFFSPNRRATSRRPEGEAVPAPREVTREPSIATASRAEFRKPSAQVWWAVWVLPESAPASSRRSGAAQMAAVGGRPDSCPNQVERAGVLAQVEYGRTTR